MNALEAIRRVAKVPGCENEAAIISIHVGAATQRIEELEAELAEANKKATQRGARLQIMWQWLNKYYNEFSHVHLSEDFNDDYPEAAVADWFDEDGVPR